MMVTPSTVTALWSDGPAPPRRLGAPAFGSASRKPYDCSSVISCRLEASGVVIVLNVSTYVLVVKLGHDSFTTAHMAEHLAKAAQDKDNVIAALNRFTALASETDQCSSVLTAKASRPMLKPCRNTGRLS